MIKSAAMPNRPPIKVKRGDESNLPFRPMSCEYAQQNGDDELNAQGEVRADIAIGTTDARLFVGIVFVDGFHSATHNGWGVRD